MATPEPWPAASHGPLTEVATDLWIVDAELPDLPIGRRMTLWRTADGGLAAHSAVACDAATMAQLDALGPVRWIVVPSGFHRLDAPRWKARYPDARVVAMPAAHRRVGARVPVDGDYGALPTGGRVEVEPLAGVPAEAVFIHRADDARLTLIFNDGFMNLPDRLPGAKGWVMKLLGSTGGPKVTWTARTFIVKD
ncbi:MAG: hypothetical protein IPL61_12020 [Myxococcales bacterium]|nr:hypothetical protein [Myxococcales bacterium]